MIISELQKTLYKLATEAMHRAYNPYSHYSVGAALQTTQGLVTSGCNVENVSFRLTLCAEANAIGALVGQHGKQTIEHILIVASGSNFPSPCGACRQIIAEFALPETEVHLARAKESHDGFEVRTYRISKLLPLSFTQQSMASEVVNQTEHDASSELTPTHSYKNRQETQNKQSTEQNN
jgi:cytidine deaminase